ncbi:hypothetical protein EJ03DRAFT_205356 [Teratosphaeria nubilosa]|uniref:Uncharacterized protein n=1 Tax=Teratosphaeria nubilosa TaxID=161662 RepID=A0A6G1KY15_9PEZI|nr:hypothetical protein EJ03DRAFT_205356 [Teratosphaeria nubilosa]
MAIALAVARNAIAAGTTIPTIREERELKYRYLGRWFLTAQAHGHCKTAILYLPPSVTQRSETAYVPRFVKPPLIGWSLKALCRHTPQFLSHLYTHQGSNESSYLVLWTVASDSSGFRGSALGLLCSCILVQAGPRLRRRLTLARGRYDVHRPDFDELPVCQCWTSALHSSRTPGVRCPRERNKAGRPYTTP